MTGLNFVDQAAPAFERLPPSKMNFEHGARATPHFGQAAGICTKAPQPVGEKLSLTRLDEDSAIVPPDKPPDFAVGRADRDDRSAGGGDAIELARHHKAFDFGP